MPKHLTKGDYFSVMDLRYNDLRTRVQTLIHLRTGDPIANIGTADDPTVNTRPIAERKRHLNEDWFGAPRPGGNGSSGWWRNWRGDAEDTFREGLIRAIEVSLGIEHRCNLHPNPRNEADPELNRLRRLCPLPMDFYWVCGVSRFEVHVSWNTHQVTVITLTPGFDEPIEDFPPDPEPALSTWAATRDVGMIWVGQRYDLNSQDVATMTGQPYAHHHTRIDNVTPPAAAPVGGSGTWP